MKNAVNEIRSGAIDKLYEKIRQEVDNVIITWISLEISNRIYSRIDFPIKLIIHQNIAEELLKREIRWKRSN